MAVALHALLRNTALDPYLKLGLNVAAPHVTQDDVERAYRVRCRLVHPDKWKDTRAADAFHGLKEAREAVLWHIQQQQAGTGAARSSSSNGAGGAAGGRNRWDDFLRGSDDVPLAPGPGQGNYWADPALAQVRPHSRVCPHALCQERSTPGYDDVVKRMVVLLFAGHPHFHSTLDVCVCTWTSVDVGAVGGACVHLSMHAVRQMHQLHQHQHQHQQL